MNKKQVFVWLGLILIADGLLSMGNGLFGWFTPGNGLDVWWIQLLRIPRIAIGFYLLKQGLK